MHFSTTNSQKKQQEPNFGCKCEHQGRYHRFFDMLHASPFFSLQFVSLTSDMTKAIVVGRDDKLGIGTSVENMQPRVVNRAFLNRFQSWNDSVLAICPLESVSIWECLKITLSIF